MRSEGSSVESVTGTLLIADDSVEFGQMLVRRAEKIGCRTNFAVNVREAKALLRKKSFDLLAVDMYMPDGTGLDILDAAREKDPDIHAIVLTGSATLENAIDSLRAGVFEYLTKPLEPAAAFDIAVLRALERRILILENKRLFDENQRLAKLDPLTGLLNRFEMRRLLKKEIERAFRYGRKLAVLMLDLDHFKEINDSFGHIMGDQVLIHVAKTIRAAIRSVDYAARFGGDEFIVIMPEADLKTAVDAAQRIIDVLGEPFSDIGPVRISGGAAVWDQSMLSIEALLKAADDVLYQAKAIRRDNSVIAVDIRGVSAQA
ncbi:MAG: diguanylate cyclase [Anaerolineales bacterium]|nr:diguanylate cyclase [Anaerolineales bacterium]